jgi:uncharacterized damage-inducible protein DinB
MDAFIAQSRRLLVDSHLPRIRRCLERLSDEQLWWRANEESNSVGNLVLHLAGNVRQWIVSGVGRQPDHRQRQQEFDERGPVPRELLLERLESAVRDADETLARLAPGALLEPRRIQEHDVTVLEAIYHVVEHFAMHAGQIIFATKMWHGDVKFYDLSDGAPRPTWTRRGP